MGWGGWIQTVVNLALFVTCLVNAWHSMRLRRLVLGTPLQVVFLSLAALWAVATVFAWHLVGHAAGRW